MIEFQVAGPYELPCYKSDGVWHFDKKKEKLFWKERTNDLSFDLSARNGCYIFAMATKNFMPWYVGKTWNGFRNESFGPYQQTKIAKFINKHGTPVVFFVYKSYKLKEGESTKEIIREIERFLTQSAVWINPNLLNVHGVNAQWKIRGSIRSDSIAGNPGNAISGFRKMLDF